MSEPNRLKLRTTIMLVSMIALPAAAVVGIKWPAFFRSEQAWTKEKPSTSASSLSRAASGGRAGQAMPKSTTPALTGSAAIALAEQRQTSSEPSDYPVAQAKNIVVRPESNGAILPAVAGDEPASTTAGLVGAVALQPLKVQANEEFTRIQQRLRGLGATHYVLETWGPTGEAYRFQCRMAAGHDAHYSRHFEATDVEPLRAMQTVLDDVESWKSGRLP